MKLENLTQEQKEVVEEFLNCLSAYGNTKGNLAKFAGIKNFDTAYPEPYASRIREIFPQFNGMFMVYNYDTARVWGEFTNVAEKAITALYTKLNEN
jgi:hypothetical protein